MAVLAKSSPADLEKAWEKLNQPPLYRYLRRPETGLVMVRARAGGTGLRFNLGEMTVSRCTVQLEAGPIGCGYVAGRNLAHAEIAAVFDALLQNPEEEAFLRKEIIEPLEEALSARKARETARAASTKVDFFTLVRGE